MLTLLVQAAIAMFIGRMHLWYGVAKVGCMEERKISGCEVRLLLTNDRSVGKKHKEGERPCR